MIAGRRERKRSLIRASAIKEIIARNMTMADGVVRRYQPQKQSQPDEKAAFAKKSVPGLYPSISQYRGSTQQLSGYLKQLLTLHSAGILTDEEYSAAKNRLIGS